jgi:O-antigen/teichoic acid export membrane protein
VTDRTGPGWEGGVAGRLANLAVARIVAQGLGLGWFLYAARELGARDFGVLSTGLALVVIIGGLSDLGTTRTVVRHVAADPGSLRANYVTAGAVRTAAGAAFGLIAVGALRLVAPDVPTAVVGLAAVVAAVSGLTEVGFACLRSTGRVGTEVGLLVGERLLFVLVGVGVVSARHRPGGVLVV